MTFSAAAMR
jgi:ribosome biogenesis GTPase A